jgi:hypothetical protein
MPVIVQRSAVQLSRCVLDLAAACVCVLVSVQVASHLFRHVEEEQAAE